MTVSLMKLDSFSSELAIDSLSVQLVASSARALRTRAPWRLRAGFIEPLNAMATAAHHASVASTSMCSAHRLRSKQSKNISAPHRTRRRSVVPHAASLPSLTSDSTWRLQFEFFSGKDDSTTPDRVITSKVKFVLDEGYEPPQGLIEIVEDLEGMFSAVETTATGVQMNNRWTLEEDPNEKSAGLWIWGLFEDPLYPYLVFSMDVNRIDVADGGKYHIPSGTLFAEVKHQRGSKSGSVLTDGVLSFKVTKTYQADLVGLSKVTVGEPNQCGRLKAECV